MSGLLWFIAGFVSCLLVSLLGVSLFVWRTPPAREQVNDENLPSSREPDHPQPSVHSAVRRQAGKRTR
jgi:hypothetical protein